MRDLPWTLHRAIGMALAFLRFEELPKEEQPPREIWFDAERMEEHWKAVEKRRDERYGNKSQGVEDGGEMKKNAMLDEIYVK